MDFLILIAIVVIGYFCFNSSRVTSIASFNATLILPLFAMGLALVASALNTSVGKILALIGLGIVLIIIWATLSNKRKSEEVEKISDDS
jgi:Ca2+/Na+ antiporter